MRRKNKRPHQTLIVGITGGTGAGKSIISRIFNDLGAHIIDADKVGRLTLENDEKVKEKVIASFGDSILSPDGKISRKSLGKIVFNDPAKLRLLNSIIHPPMIKTIKREINQIIQSGKNTITAVDAALIFEAEVESYFDIIIAVTADDELRISRLQQRGLSRENALTRIHSQIPQNEKCDKAHLIVENNGTIQDLEEKATGLYKKILEQFTQK